jgi:hypothetical protein
MLPQPALPFRQGPMSRCPLAIRPAPGVYGNRRGFGDFRSCCARTLPAARVGQGATTHHGIHAALFVCWQ